MLHRQPMDCSEARALVAGYLDEELSEAQAAPLRQHLMDCPGCRQLAADDKALRAWFVQESEPEVPVGFAARVAQAAFAGAQPGEGTYEHVPEGVVLTPAARRPELVTGRPEPALSSLTADAGAVREEASALHGYVLQLTAMAAAILIMLSLGLRRLELPGGTNLRADDSSLEQAIEELEALNEAERARLLDEENGADENAED